MVLVHGAMDRNTSFARVAEALAPLPVVRYDRRGYGRSRTAGTGDLATHVADLVTILDGQPATVVGHSFGGLVALGAAALAPDLVTAVGSYEAPVPWVEWWPYRSALLAEDPEGAAERFLRHHIGDDRWERLPRRWREERRAEGMAMAHENIGLGPPDPPFDPTRLVMPVVIGRGGASGPRAARGRPRAQRPGGRRRGARGGRCRPRGAGHRPGGVRRVRAGHPLPGPSGRSVACPPMRSLRGMLGRHRPTCTAFVLSGGGNMGALQVGMLRALFERHIRPDLVLGCSVGALNGAAVAGEPSLAMVGRLEGVWVDLEHRKLLPAGILPATVQLARRGIALHTNNGLRSLVEQVIGTRTFADLVVPFQCVATDIDQAREVWFSEGPLIEPILASAALPAVLPPVEIDGIRYMDGAVLNDVPVTRAVGLGATHVYVLHTGTFDRPRPEPRRPLDVALQAYWIARRARFQRDLAALPPDVTVTILPTGEAPVVRFNDLRQSRRLIDVAYQASVEALDGGGSAADEGVADLSPHPV